MCGTGRQDGYSLLELLVILAIVALSAGLLTGIGPTHRQARDLKLETYRLETDLRAARSAAIFAGQSVAFTIDVGQGAWRYGNRPTYATRQGIQLTLHTGRSLLNGGDAGAIVFFPNGQSSGGHIVLQADALRNRIDVDWLTGRVHTNGDAGAP